MRARSLVIPALLILSFAVLLTGCNDRAGSEAPTEAGAVVSEVNQQVDPPADPAPADQPTDQTDQTDKPEAAEADAPIEGNVITRSLPRFHDAFPSDQAYLAWMETFYIHKDFSRTPEAIGYFCSSELFQDRELRIPMSDFFGMVLRQSDETVDLCYDELMLEGRIDELTMLGYAAWFANTPHSRQMIYKAREIWKEHQLVDMFHITHQTKITDSMDRNLAVEPKVVRMLWYEFFATGDEARLRRVVLSSYLHNAPEGTWHRVAGQLARASLVRVLPFDPLVRKVVEHEAAENPSPQIRNHLTRLLEEIGPLRQRPGTEPDK